MFLKMNEAIACCSALWGYLAATAGEHSQGRQAANLASGAERPPPTSTSEEGSEAFVFRQ